VTMVWCGGCVGDGGGVGAGGSCWSGVMVARRRLSWKGNHGGGDGCDSGRNTSFSQESAPTFAELFEINKLKAQSVKERKVKRKIEEIETLNIELDHRVTKLVAENEHLKQTYKQLYESIKPSRVRSKEQCDDLIKQVNLKSAEISDLNASLQEKVLVITALKESLSKLKGKNVVNEAVLLHSIDPDLLKIDVAPLAPKLHKNRIIHTNYIRHTLEEAATLREIVESERLINPLNTSLDYACKYTKRIQELLNILQQTCPCIIDLGSKLVVVTPKNKNKHIRFTEQIYKSGKTTAKTTPSTNIVSNTPVLSSTRVNLLSSASGSKSQDNTKNDRIHRTPRKVKQNKLEEHLRKVRPSLNKKSVVNTKATSSVTNFMSNVNSDLKCASCNGCLFSDNHDACVVAYINSVNASIKSKSVKKPVKRRIWQPTGKMLATTTIVPPREPIPIASNTDKHVITLVYSRKSKATNKRVPVSNSTMNKSLVANTMEPNNSWGSSSSNVPSSLLECMLSKLFSGQFCDSDLEIAFRQHTCFIRNLDGVDLLTGSRGNNLYTLSLQDMMASSPICLLSKASKTKSWLWHRGLSHLNFACAMGKSMKKSYKPKSEDTNQEKLYLLHMDLYGPMRVESVNGKKGCGNRLFYPKSIHQLLHNKLPDLSFFYVFGALCYPTNDSENLGKLQPKADIGIFIGSGPALHEMTPATISSGFMQKSSSSTPFVPPSRNDWDLLFQPMFNELLNPPPSVDHQAAQVIAPIVEVIPQVQDDSTVIPQEVEDDNLDIEVAHIRNDSLLGVLITEVTSAQSSSMVSPH
nr:integrase, catalytic region, zinc finger, CCHC-type, peptidase aspartic, catalytic [Tanacetum cinerariifolium]